MKKMGETVLIFILGGLVAAVPYYLSQRGSAKQKKEIRTAATKQTQEIINGMKSLYQISQKIDSLSDSIQKGDFTPQTINELRETSEKFSQSFAQWAQTVESRKEILKVERKVKDLSGQALAKALSDSVRGHYLYFLDSLKKHIEAIRSAEFPVQYKTVATLPDRIMEAREPVIGGNAVPLAEVLFPSGRMWKVIYTSGGASIADQFFPYFHVTLGNQGSNYFELHMQQKPDGKIVFSIRTNYASIRDKIGVEDGDLNQFEPKIDSILQALLEVELAYQEQ